MLDFTKGFTGILLLMILLTPVISFAQTNIETFSQLQFNFNNPGARAAGIGGAFISIADDATAAEANPAGLTALIQPEITAELKAVQYSRNIFNFSSEGSQGSFSLVGKDFNDSIVSPSFFSLVYPINKITLSAFRYELVNFKSSFFTRTAFVPGFQDGTAYFPVESDLDISVVNWGAAAGFKAHEKLSVGIAFGFSQFDLNSRLRRLAFPMSPDQRSEALFTIDDSDSDIFLSIGVIFKPSDKISIGGIFKKRPQFSAMQRLERPRFALDETNEINFKIPSAFGAGISIRPSDFLTLSTDIVRISYSDITDDFTITEANAVINPEDFSVKDGTEIHVGAEYITFLKNFGIVFRGGFFTEPDNRIQFVGEPSGNFLRKTTQILFQGGDSDAHFTFGLGLLLSDNLQLDLAGNLSDGSNELVASFVYRLKK